MSPQPNPHIGSSFDAFLAEEGMLDACEEQAIKELVADTDRTRYAGAGANTDGHGGTHADEPCGFEPAVRSR